MKKHVFTDRNGMSQSCSVAHIGKGQCLKCLTCNEWIAADEQAGECLEVTKSGER